jgi:hypothetical protein
MIGSTLRFVPLAALSLAVPLACASPSTDAAGVSEQRDAATIPNQPAPNPARDAGRDTGGARPEAGDDADGRVEVAGRLLDGQGRYPVNGATITWAGSVVASSTTGEFIVRVAPGAIASPFITAPGYLQFNFQELSASGNSSFGALFMISQSTASLLKNISLPGYDANKGVLAVYVTAQPGCASSAGTTLAISPAGSSGVLYFSGGLPSASQTSVDPKETPSALFFNVDANVPLTIAASSPACSQAPYPVTESTITYTGAMTAAPGDQFTFARVFMK